MINLYQWPSDGKLPNGGFFCMKLESYLRLQKLEHKVHSVSSFGKSPKQTMPYIERDGVYTSDSQLIIDELESKSKEALNAHLTEDQRAQAHAYQMMLEEHLIPIVIYFRWYPDSGWRQFSRIMFHGAPALVRVMIGGLLRGKRLRAMHSTGLSRHSVDELVLFARRDLSAISRLLGDKDYFFNGKPSLLDIVAYTVVSNILMGGVEMPLIGEVKKYPNLVSHAERMMKLVFQRGIN